MKESRFADGLDGEGGVGSCVAGATGDAVGEEDVVEAMMEGGLAGGMMRAVRAPSGLGLRLLKLPIGLANPLLLRTAGVRTEMWSDADASASARMVAAEDEEWTEVGEDGMDAGDREPSRASVVRRWVDVRWFVFAAAKPPEEVMWRRVSLSCWFILTVGGGGGCSGGGGM
ncbi:hypothetical protein BD779DRAFT_1554166 [Infundibulicybe gibba]|nr:hypothetical protein BD779DRAFT_1554166 [Infundibulicybe gibba]